MIRKILGVLMALFSLTIATQAQQVTSFGAIDVGPLYVREHIRTLNKAQNDWVIWATRNTSFSETRMDLANLSSVSIGAGAFDPNYKLSVYNPGSTTGIQLGSMNSGLTALLIGTSAHADGYTFLQSVKNAGANYGNLIFNQNGGNVGIGTASPSSKLHVVSTGTNIDGGNSNAVGGDMVIQSNIPGRSNTVGAQLEFALPANSDGSNIWGQAHIITVAGNQNSGNASGKMIFGTRRYFDKHHDGNIQWFYGDDIVINDAGNVGIGTLSPDKLLSVKGTIHANEVLVDMTVPGPDFVFEKDYDLLPLAEVENYIKVNKHLPEVPSAKEMEKEGLNLKEMNLLLLKKVEELTLHVIGQEKEIRQLRDQNKIILEAMDRMRKR